MPKFFANKNQFTPSKTDLENGLQPLDAITGSLVSSDIRRGNCSSGFWLVFKVKKDYGYIDVFFDALSIGESEIARFDIYRGKIVTIKSVNESPSIELAAAESEESVRASLLKGIAAGNIQTDDLPLLLEVAKGKDVPFEKWDLFKRQIENEGLEKVKEELDKEAEVSQKEIEKKEARLSRLKELRSEVDAEEEKMLGEVYSALMFLQGGEDLAGSHFCFSSVNSSENLVHVGNGYNGLMASFEKFKTKKGVYVVCEDKIYIVHDAYLEKGGRAFLLGAPKEFSRAKTEEIRQLIDRFLAFYSVPNPDDSH